MNDIPREQPAQPQQSAEIPRAPQSPQEADIGRLDPAIRRPERRLFPDWASI